MRWTSAAWVSCLLPVLAGCNTARHAVQYVTQTVTPDTGAPRAPRAGAEDLRRDAQTAWETVRSQHPKRALSDEFRDGFVDGYSDFLARGGAAQPAAVPPVPYERYKKYFGPDGHSLVRDYYLGFQYGIDVAGATGRRSGEPAARAGTPAPTGSKAPDMLPPRPLPDTGKSGEPKKSSDDPPLLLPPPGVGDGKGPLPKPEVPLIRPFNPDLPGGKFGSLLPEPDRLPAPFPPLPVSEPVAVPAPAEPSPRPLSVLDHIPVIPLTYPPK
jgi:hypothetical protein